MLVFRQVARSCAAVSLFLLAFSVIYAQEAGSSPQPVQQTEAVPAQQPAPSTSGIISGTVLDTNQNVVQGATVTLRWDGQSRTAKTGSDGQFTFGGLSPGDYRLKAGGNGLSTYTSPNIHLAQSSTVLVPSITLAYTAAGTSITVLGDKEELSVQQVQIAESQRVFGVVPNFYSSYDWHAPPMLAKQKYHLALRSLFDPVSFLEVAGVAGAEQYQGVFPAYGSGISGYAKRYGAAFANHASGNILGRAVYPAIFHQDPRYFYMGKGTVTHRALYAISTSVIARSDNGRWRPNYSSILGNFSAGAISNLYYPASDRGASLVFYNGLADIGADAVGNLIREFVLKDFTSHAPGK